MTSEVHSTPHGASAVKAFLTPAQWNIVTGRFTLSDDRLKREKQSKAKQSKLETAHPFYDLEEGNVWPVGPLVAVNTLIVRDVVS
uniref:Uncharacterized protein n=1 Tax=Strigamia maritima TaxID=126957 RepID=T1JNR0_STRMM